MAFCAADGTPLTSLSVSTLIGETVGGRYLVLSRIGAGGMGEVYLAEHVRMKRKSALKVIRPALLSEADALHRFTREAENASRISHPNVASIFDFGETDTGLVYLAMEFIEGESLGDMLAREKRLPPLVAADIIGQASDALQAAHDLGILHRDIKPDNLMISARSDGTYTVKLVDFGIARSLEWHEQQVTRTGLAVGTPEFMSPEQISGDVLDARSDQYSLALVGFLLLTGSDAFGDTNSKESLVARLTSRPRRLEEAWKEIEWPAQAQDVFDRALAPDPVDRFTSVAEFGRALTDSVLLMPRSATGAVYQRAARQRLTPTSALESDSDATRRSASSGNKKERFNSHQQESARVVGRRSRRDPLRMRRRRLPARWIVLIGVLVYGTWWYGSQQPAGSTLNVAAVEIGNASLKVREIVVGWWAALKSSTATKPAANEKPAARARSKPAGGAERTHSN